MRPALLAILAAFCLHAQSPTIPREEFSQRRAKLQKNLDGGAMVLFGWTEGPDEVYHTAQHTSFFYLTGFEDPGAILLVTPTSETLFLQPRNERRERYNGRRLAASDADVLTRTGFKEVLGVEKFESRLSKALEDAGAVLALPNDPATPKLKTIAPFREFRDATPVLAKLRMTKSAAEIAAIQYATDISMKAHLAAWKRLKPGVFEYQSAATFTQVLNEAGCERHAYEPIFGSGPNSVVLHYNANRRKMDQGEVIVIDAAATCGGYASDITRSLPIGGKFNERQKQVYEIVLGSLKAAQAALKPGVTLAEMTAVAKKYMEEHGGYGKYFLHGIGHHVGLDVHDLSTTAPLEAGAVVTLEPGIYIAEENLGVRIEEVVLVTADGAKVLTAALPREASEIEKTMAR
jgi:Xaa-Pro aminopeptidase